MNFTQLEERVLALEKSLEEVKAQLARVNGSARVAEEEELIPGVEYPLVLCAPPKDVVPLKGKLTSISEGRKDLGLSDAEWTSLGLEEHDE